MLGTKAELKKTRFYQEIREETIAEFLPFLLQTGMPLVEIAKRLKVPVKKIKEIARSIDIEA
jgi:predicted transposase YdaD